MSDIVSVLIPTYNRKDLLKGALESILYQDYPYLEIVVSDNASTDGTEEFVKSYNDSRIKYIKRPENIGGSRNFQEGFKECTGKYFFCLNDDDFLTNMSYFSRAVKVMGENPNVSLIRSVVLVKDHSKGINQIQSFNSKTIINGLEYFLNYCAEGYENIICWFGFVRRDQITQSGGIYSHYSADTFMNLTACLYGDVYFLPEVIGQYNLWGKNQASFNYDILKKVIEIPYIVGEISKLAEKLHPDQIERIRAESHKVVITCMSWSLSFLMRIKKIKELKQDLKNSNIKNDFPRVYKELSFYTSLLFSMSKVNGFDPYSGAQYNIKKSLKILGKSIIRKIISPRG